MQLTTCCKSYSLKAGTVFTGVLGIALSIVSLIMVYTLHVEWKTILVDIVDQNVVRFIFAINLCMSILISTVLIIGAVKKNTFMMLPWVVLGLILAVGLLVSVIYTSVMFFQHSEAINGILWLVVGVVIVVLYTYLWLVVYSYYQQLRYDKMNYRIGPYGRSCTYHRR